jgi:Ca2+:H+ antiporter
MLLRILLVSSIAIVTNDRRHRFQKRSVAVTLSKHLSIAVTGLLIPTALSMATTPNTTKIDKQSRGISIIFLILYALYMYSEWRTNSLLGFQLEESEKAARAVREARERKTELPKTLAHMGYQGAAIGGATIAAANVEQQKINRNAFMDPDAVADDEPRMPQLNFWISVALMVVVGALLALHVVFMCDSVQGISTSTGMSLEFIGLIMIHILGVNSTLLHLDNRYDSEEVTRTTLGLGLQTMLFVLPLLILISWIAGIKDMNLLFNPFEVTVLFPAVLIVQASIEEKDNGW